MGQMLLQQRNGPLHRLVSEVVGWVGEAGVESSDQVIRPYRRVVPTAVIQQASRVAGLPVACDPLMDDYAAHPEQICDLGYGTTLCCFQQTQGTSENSGVLRELQLILEVRPLLFRQLKSAHAAPLN